MASASARSPRFSWGSLSLGHKALIIIVTAILGLLAASAAITRTIVTEQYRELEEAGIKRDLLNATNILAHEASVLSSIVKDWASWDDTYTFLQDRNESYLEVNYVDETFINGRITLAVIISSGGEIVFTKAFDLEDEEEISMPNDLLQHVVEVHIKAYAPNSLNGTAGIVSISEKLYLLASYPVLQSDDSGPVRGALLMGRRLSDAEVSRLTPMMPVPVAITSLSLPTVQHTSTEGTNYPTIPQNMSIRPISEDEVLGSVRLTDIYGKATHQLTATFTRTIFHQGQSTIAQILFTSLAAGVTIGLIAQFLVRREIVNRLTSLSGSVAEIRIHGRSTARVPRSGDDEIGLLAKEINKLLEAQQISEAHLRQKEEQALVLSERAEAASQAKSQFLAMMSHELRTPLNSIIGFANLLNYTKIDEEQLEFVETIQEGGDHLLALISNILDYTKLEATSVVLDVQATNLLGELQKVEREFRLPADQKGIELIVSATENVPKYVETDADRLRQIVVILVDNAVKFTESGTVTIGADARWDTNEERWDLILTVTDTGIGIPEEKQESIFHLFEQAEPLLNRRYGGSGLGLAICRLQVERMGGSVSCRSTPGNGSQFIVTLPAGTAAPESVEQEASDQESDEPADASPLRIIYVEDDPGSQAVMRAALSKLGHEVEVVSDSKQFRETIENRTFDLVILDLELNGETGFELTGRLREGTWGEAAKDVYIVGISALALADGQARSLESGMNDYIPKPISLQVLRQTIAKARPRV